MKNHKDSGLTLIELFIIIIIIGILSSVAVPAFVRHIKSAEQEHQKHVQTTASVNTSPSQTQDPRYKTFLIEIKIPFVNYDLDWENRDATLTDYTRNFFNSLDKEVTAILAKNPNCNYKSREIVSGFIHLRSTQYGGDIIQLPSAASLVLDCNQ